MRLLSVSLILFGLALAPVGLAAEVYAPVSPVSPASPPSLVSPASPGATHERTDVHCHVTCVDPHPTCAESQKVIEILQKLVTAYSAGDLKTYEHYLDEHAASFNEDTKQIIAGKENVLKSLQTEFTNHAPGGKEPLLSFTIDQPFAKVTNNTCSVTFVATRKVGGANPRTEVANITDVFLKHENGDWKKLWWRGSWRTIPSQ